MTDLNKEIIISSSDFKTLFKNREDVYDLVENFCVNEQDQVVIILLYEGVEIDEIVNLKISDCNFENSTIIVSTDSGISRNIALPKRAMNIIAKSRNEIEYNINNGRSDGVLLPLAFGLLPSEYIIRFTNYKILYPIRADSSFVYKQLKNILRTLGIKI